MLSLEKFVYSAKTSPSPEPSPAQRLGGSKKSCRPASCPFRALSRARIRAGVGLWGLETLCLVEQIHSTNPGRARSAGRGCGPGTSDNGGGASPELVRNLLAGTVQSPIGAGLRRQELLRGRRDTPAKSSAAALATQSTAFGREIVKKWGVVEKGLRD